MNSASGGPSSNSDTEDGPPCIDTDLYSRQIGAFGLETMGKLIKLRILICGLNGPGVETAKNLILAGPNTVALYDDTTTTIQDLASNFYITEDDVGRGLSRAQASFKRLSELNDYVNTTVLMGPLTSSVLSGFDLVVVCDMKLSEMIQLNNYCRSRSPMAGFIAASSFGLCGSVFVDFGDEFTVFDKDGEPPKSAIIEGITQDFPATVHLHQDKVCPFSTGDHVRFKEIRGMNELNDLVQPVQIKVSGKYTFTIPCDTKAFAAYQHDGIVEQVKVSSKVHFQSLEHCLMRPLPAGEHGLIVPDLAKLDQSEQLHFAVHSVHKYREKHGSLPPPRCASAVEECFAYAQGLLEEAKALAATEVQNLPSGDLEQCWRPVVVESIDRTVLENVVNFAACDISPMAAFLGGVVAQEVVKYTGKFTPLRQWLHYDAFECLLKTVPDDTKPLNCRYDHQIAIWGKKFQNRLGQIKMFLVGAGALGCEFLKSFAFMGCCTKEQGGSLVITDMDRVEVSNLNRQFLFRRQHVGASKALTASEVAMQMNSSLNIVAFETRVGPETEEDFNDEFWSGLDFVVNALDNVQSRLYIDSRCVWHHKPLLESGTLGTKANSQVIIPRMTQSYGDSQDPPEDSIPLCTLRHFPNQIEHTIEWARDLFQGLFCDGPQETKAFLSNVNDFLLRLNTEGTSATQRERLCKMHNLLTILLEKPTMEKCVSEAVKLFVSYFDHPIAQLLYMFPLHHVTSGGLPFWTGPKRPPQTLHFDPKDPLHLEFVFSAANLIAYNLRIPQERDIEKLRLLAEQVPVKAFEPKEVRIKVDESDTTVEGAADDEVVVYRLQQELLQIADQLQQRNLLDRVTTVEFEKDDDTNFHIDFISACANLRARNYRISECARHTTKMIAGKIIPAIATTTAMVTGLVSFELLKVVSLEERAIEDFKNAFINLSLPLFILSQPMPPVSTKDKEYDPIARGPVRARPNGFTPWDVLVLNIPNATLGQLIEEIENKQQVEVAILSVGNACLYNSFLKSHKDRLNQNVKELTEVINKTQLPRGRKYIAVEASCADLDGVDVIIPTIKLVF